MQRASQLLVETQQEAQMTHPRTLLAGCLCLALVTLVGAAPSTQPTDAEKENVELRKRVAALEAQVKSLEDQVAKLKRRDGAFVLPRLPQAPSLPQPPALPYRFDRAPQQPEPGRDWIPRDFNGRTIYIVPCTPAIDSTPVAK
jgi:hypothetical protein